jgi:hypothetical protein
LKGGTLKKYADDAKKQISVLLKIKVEKIEDDEAEK